MKPHITMITLGVKDLQASVKFYRDVLDLPMNEGSGEGVAFFGLENIILGLYPKDKLAEDAKVLAKGSGFSGFSLAHNLESKEEVDVFFKDLDLKNVEIIKPPEEVFWGGYSGYFADPDGYLWEVAWNPVGF